MPALANSSSVKNEISSAPSFSFSQNSFTSRQPGNRAAMPMIAMAFGGISTSVIDRSVSAATESGSSSVMADIMPLLLGCRSFRYSARELMGGYLKRSMMVSALQQ